MKLTRTANTSADAAPSVPARAGPLKIATKSRLRVATSGGTRMIRPNAAPAYQDGAADQKLTPLTWTEEQRGQGGAHHGRQPHGQAIECEQRAWAAEIEIGRDPPQRHDQKRHFQNVDRGQHDRFEKRVAAQQITGIQPAIAGDQNERQHAGGAP